LLVTPTSFGKCDARLKSDLEALVGEVVYNTTGKPMSTELLTQMLPGVDGYIAGLEPITREALAAADRLKVIARYGVGVDAVDLEAAKERGIVVTNTPGANSVSVAELTLGLMLALVRQIPEGAAAVRKGQFPRLNGMSLERKNIGIVGLGAIGKQLARRLAGFDACLLAYDPFPDAGFAEKHDVQILPLDELLAVSDIVSLHLPLMPATHSMVNQEFLAKMKRGAFLVNTSRGELVDETALLEALESGHLRGVGMDAFAQEPVDPANPLLALPQVIPTPHLGAQTDGATNAMGWMSVEGCLSVLRGEEPAHRVV
jgi:D-3-phosphoglycerate dehydrogenase